MAIYFTSDTHFGHDKDFIYALRGFNSIQEHDEAIMKNWNKEIKMNDIVYHLGDVCLGDDEKSIEYLKRLHGKIHIILGNHDSDRRIQLYKECKNVVSVSFAERIKVGKYTLFLSHAPSNTYVIGKRLGRTMLNLFGHTHQTDSPFINDIPYAYNVGLDCHNNKPVSIEQIMNEIHEQYELYRYVNPEVFEKYEQNKDRFERKTIIALPIKEVIDERDEYL